MIIVTAEFDLADPAALPDAMAVATPLQAATRREEPGCLAYVFSPDPCLEGRIQVFELWADHDSLATHFEHPNYRDMGAGLGQVGLASVVATKFRVTAVEPVYDPDRVARADFFTEDVQAPDQAIIIAGTLDVPDPALRDDALVRSIPLQLATRREEPGCEHYVFSADPCREDRIVVYELWDDQAALAPHFTHENYHRMGGLLRGLGGTSDHKKYRCDHREPVYDDSRTPRADFFTVSQP